MFGPADRDQLDRLVVEQIPAALAFAQRLTGSSDEADDVVQEALTKVLQHWRRYRGEAQFSTWMLGIVLNVIRDRRRRRPPPKPLSTDVADGRPQAAEYLDASELAERVRAAIDSLPERQREVALLALVEGVPPSDVANLLDTTPANIYTTLHHVRKKLIHVIDFARTPDE